MADEATKRTQLMGRLTTYIDRANAAEFQELDFYQVAARIDRVKTLFLELSNSNDFVAAATAPVNLAAVTQEFYDFEDLYLDALAKMNRRFVELTPAVAVAGLPPIDQRALPVREEDARPVYEVRMPMQMNNVSDTWGIFNGDRLSWSEWKDKFRVAVHECNDFTPVQKFMLLKKALVGEPSQMVSQWSLNNENYEQAWTRLETKYNKKYPLACAHLGKFFALPFHQKRANGAQLQLMSNVTHELMRHMHTLEYNTDGWDLILVHALQARLDAHHRKEWDKVRKENENPTWKNIVDFLDKESNDASDKAMYRPTGPPVYSEPMQTRYVDPDYPRPPIGSVLAFPCPICKQNTHKVFDCPEFRPLSVHERIKIAHLNRLCPNCLRRGHTKDDCHDKHTCSYDQCAGDPRHNSMLGPYKDAPGRVSAAQYASDRQSSTSDWQRDYRGARGGRDTASGHFQ